MREAGMREKRWIVLCTDGRHVTLGRHSDPTDDEVLRAEEALRVQGLAGWLAVTSGVYYGRGPIEILQVRPLGEPAAESWTAAAAAFRAQRETAKKGLPS